MGLTAGSHALAHQRHRLRLERGEVVRSTVTSRYGRGIGVGRGLGRGVGLGAAVAVGFGVAVGVAVAVGVGVGVV